MGNRYCTLWVGYRVELRNQRRVCRTWRTWTDATGGGFINSFGSFGAILCTVYVDSLLDVRGQNLSKKDNLFIADLLTELLKNRRSNDRTVRGRFGN
jgi:hypothetical protein